MSSIAILVRMDWPSGAIDRLIDASGPWPDSDGNIWQGCELTDGLDAIEQAMNGDAFTLNLALMGVSVNISKPVWLSYNNDEIINARVRIYIQNCNEKDRPIGEPETKFTGRIDNVIFEDYSEDEEIISNIVLECTNRFTLRRIKNGAVLSDPDQKARSKVLNPTGNPDRFCERVYLLEDKTIVWPRWK